MKKRIASIVIALAIIALSVPVAFAASTLAYTAEYDMAEDCFTVAGTVTGGVANTPLTLVVKTGETFIAGYQTATVAGENGNITFEFDKVKLPYSAPTGVYSFIVTGSGLTATAPTYPYLSVEDKRAFIVALNTLISGGGDGIYEKVATKASEFGLPVAEFNALDDAAQGVYDKFMTTAPYDVPGTAVTDDEGAAKVTVACTKFKENSDNALIYASFANIKNKATKDVWFDKYYEALEFDKDDASTTEKEDKISKYLEYVTDSATFVNRISTYTIPATLNVDVLKGYVNESILLSAIEVMHLSNTYTIMTDFPEKFPVNTRNLSKLSVDGQSNIYAQIANNYYGTYADVVSAFDAKVLAAIENKDNGSGSSGGWGGGGGGGSAVIIDGVAETPEVQPETKPEGFTDIADVPWARNAINYLSANKIINGKSENIFDPNANITRAEFVKILVVALGLEAPNSDNVSFGDVPADAWYADFVAAAASAGLVMGDDNNNFSPDSPITRQDMSVILYRGFKPEAKGEAASFDDSADISDYATEAVAALSAAKIVNGTGNNMFSPLNCATRAEAAVMVYNLLK